MRNAPKIAAIVAMDQSRVIGFEGRLPWHLPEDLAHFKSLTSGGVVIMGRKTWDSLPAKFKPLPNRINVVVSRKAAELALPEGVLRAHAPEESVLVARDAARMAETIWVIGGAELYAALLPYCDEVHVTRVKGVHQGDAWFPRFEADFEHISEQSGESCSFHVYANRAAKVL